ncbi:Ion channel and transmembrane domain-containing protein [Spironucleus salmonicida]|uniref:Ion channel and transmembrane domain-containing protein n=1 Tax=Spironucleus salmonicida TaxID=348837 RepID=V6LSE1_9EUKA|nr:Ion channel and transmembrane domain-containing protein [Spironucleus salmonicida]|eukprot:EST43669.1 Ion channel and transmembrane domain-containing protein [Spironucleus salmonicida]
MDKEQDRLWIGYEKQIGHGTSSNLDQFLLTIEYMQGYQAYALLLTLTDIIAFFVNHQFPSDYDPGSNSITTVFFICISISHALLQTLDLITVASFGIKNQVQWFNISFLLYFFSVFSYYVVGIYYFLTDISYYQVIKLRLGFLTIFRGYVRAISRRNKMRFSKAIIKQCKQHAFVLNTVFIFKSIAVVIQCIYGPICFLVVCMGLIFLLNIYQQDAKTFVDSLYFIVVTIATVGYGDVVLEGQIGRLMNVCIILFAIGYAPYAISYIVNRLRTEFSKLFLQRAIFGGVVVIGKKDMDTFKCLRIVLPPNQSIQFLIQTSETTLEENEDVRLFGQINQKVNYHFKEQFDRQDLAYLAVNQSILTIVFSKENPDSTIEEDGQTIFNAVQLAQVLEEGNIMLIFLQHNQSIEICRDTIKQYIKPQQFYIYSIGKVMSHLIAVSSYYKGFSTFFYNMLLPNRCQINKQPMRQLNLVQKRLDNLVNHLHSDEYNKNNEKLELFEFYNKSCGISSELKHYIFNAKRNNQNKLKVETPISQYYKGEKAKILIVVIGNINQCLFDQTMDKFNLDELEVYLLLHQANILKFDSAISYDGDIFNPQTYRKADASVLIFMDDNNGREVMLQHILEQAQVNYTFCCQESMLEIQDKLRLYQSQNYMPFGMSSLISIAAKQPLVFQKAYQFLKSFQCMQYQILSYKTIEMWEAVHSQEFIIYIIRDNCVINRYDKQFDLYKGDTITAVRTQ